MSERHGRRKRFEIEDSIESTASAEVVMDRLLSPASWPEWQTEIDSVERSGKLTEPGEIVRGQATLLGFKVDGHSTATQVSEDVFEEDVLVGVRMKVRYTVARGATGTTISHRLISDLPGGPSGAVLSLLLKWRLRRMQKRLLRELAAQAERRPQAEGVAPSA